MKKLIILLFFVPFLLNAQSLTSPKLIDKDMDYRYQYTDTLKKDAVISQYYYVPDFCQDVRIQLNLTKFSGTYIKTSTVLYGSLDYVNWVSLASATVTAGATTATNTALVNTVFWKYIKATTTAIDSVQNTRFEYRILFNTNK